jgi:hypothetical protein
MPWEGHGGEECVPPLPAPSFIHSLLMRERHSKNLRNRSSLSHRKLLQILNSSSDCGTTSCLIFSVNFSGSGSACTSVFGLGLGE